MTFQDDCEMTRAAFTRGEEPLFAVDNLIEAFYAMPDNGAGGRLHNVLDDSNLEDEHIDWCVNLAKSQGDVDAVALGELLRAMTLRQRLQVPACNCPCGCTNELRESVGLPPIEPSVIAEETASGGILIRSARDEAPAPPPGGWLTFEVVGTLKPRE